jgi:hypothetical protein
MALGVYTKVLKDDFNRANEEPVTGWTDYSGNGMRIVSNAITKAVGDGGAYWAADAALTDFEAYFLVATAPDGADYMQFRSDGSNIYELRFGNGDVYKHPGATLVFSCTGFPLTAGQELAVQAIGSAIEVFVDGVSKGSGTDATYASGRIALESYGTMAMDSFSLGTTAAASFLPRMMVVN